MSATYIGLNTIFTTELSHTQNSDLSVIVNWKQRIWATEAFTAPILGAVYSYLGSVNVRVIRVVITKTIGAFTDIETTLEGAGLSNPSASSGTQESIGALTEEPIQTHPNFSSIVALATTAGVTFDENQNFVGFNKNATAGLAGVQSYLSPRLSYRRSYTTSVTPTLINVGRIFASNAFGDFPAVTSGANWLLSSINFTSKGGTLNVSEDYLASESTGWNPFIYLEST